MGYAVRTNGRGLDTEWLVEGDEDSAEQPQYTINGGKVDIDTATLQRQNLGNK